VDLAVAIGYATEAALPIAKYASQYGQNTLTVNPLPLRFDVTLQKPTFTDQQLQGWVNSIKSQNNLSNDTCLVVLNPQGVENTSDSRGAGVGGYHWKASIPYIMVNVNGSGLEVEDPGFVYAGSLSHEIAEMTVAPNVDRSNREVCDACGPNFVSTYLDYFDLNGDYIATSQAFPPAFPYCFYINGLAQPAWAIQGARSGERMQLWTSRVAFT
jgi:hypothetical protein